MVPGKKVPARRRRPTGAPAGRKRSLSAEQIVAAAIELIDEQGETALSLKKVAARLSTYASTIYTYFDTVEDLADAVQSALLKELKFPENYQSLPIRELIVDYMMNLRDVCSRHNSVLSSKVGTKGWFEQMRHQDRIYLRLIDAGLDDERAYVIVRTCTALVEGSGQRARISQGKDYVAEQRRTYAALDLSDLPGLKRILDLPEGKLPPGEGFRRMARVLVELLLPEHIK